MSSPTSAVPTSKAKTAYALLSEIRALILDDPLRYNQYDVLIFSTRDDALLGFPACGTVGCVAGWVTALKAAAPTRVQWPVAYAQRVLGLNNSQADELFAAHAAGADAQTRAHAQAGARHIAQFQRTYRAHLVAKKV